ncbi:MAG: hypothetical protein IPG55_05020 [Saprospiraceae bacterium]|nr:hypothetical protein [Candidatus Defluviibacterium haderslevense]
MAPHVHSDENNVIQLIYDTPDDIMSIINYHPGDPLYEKGIAGLMTINFPHFDVQGYPELQPKTVEVKRLNFE